MFEKVKSSIKAATAKRPRMMKQQTNSQNDPKVAT